ncbi:muscle, skeletal receptor tyrosine protein kinase-like isoform X1 [Schistocerca americana]|uniref:muscle, skeletal receptor tyrosine protein kinase-like isoform X1 n=1 Tax=Schistocerca americana TaxID=7009 RepID=UPI001F4FE95D|nr:muscle, skeletal receptor tyrosine protein kinase-like isoform X1 [Schistocerca americana]
MPIGSSFTFNGTINFVTWDGNTTYSDAGKCVPPCGPEAACRRFPNNTSRCVCVHDSSAATEGRKCPRVPIPVTPQPIPVIVPTNKTNGTISPPFAQEVPDKMTSEVSEAPWDGGVLAASLSLGLVVLVLGAAVACLWRRHQLARCLAAHGKHRAAATCSTAGGVVVSGVGSLSASKGLLEAERYTPNPQYTVCPAPALLLDRDSISFLHEIGEGCFGKVYKGELRRGDGRQPEVVAVKVLKEAATREAEDDFMREVETMSAFRHPNILALLGVVPRGDGPGASPWMVFEFMAHGDLAEVLRANSRALWRPLPGLPPLNKESLLLVARQVADGMSYLAAQRFVHRDLAARNCLVGAGLCVKIADFGMSRDVYTCDYYKVGGSRMLPVRWMAPESVLYGRFTLESDVWSFGVVLWEIFSLGKQPYYGQSNEEVVRLVLAGQLLAPPEDCPPLASQMMLHCWRMEPRDRPRFPDMAARLAEAQPRLPLPPGGFPLPAPTASASTAAPGAASCASGATSPSSADILDGDNYLLPSPSARDYLQPLPD